MIAPLCLMSLIMLAAFVTQWRAGNASWVDMFWSYGVGISGLAAALPSASPRHLVISLVLVIWSLRLGTAIGLRSHGNQEDPRYAKLRRAWGRQYQFRMLLFLQIQAIAAFPLLIALHASLTPRPLGPHDALALLIALGAIAGETVADAQLRHFRAAHPRNGVCDRGLWRYSRHPNYFFEFLGWCALPCFAWPLPAAMLLACLAPAAIYVLLVHISGIPPLEAHMLASRGQAFRAYQARTPAFFPWPRFPSSESRS